MVPWHCAIGRSFETFFGLLNRTLPSETVDPVAHFFKCYLAGFATVATSLVEKVI